MKLETKQALVRGREVTRYFVDGQRTSKEIYEQLSVSAPPPGAATPVTVICASKPCSQPWEQMSSTVLSSFKLCNQCGRLVHFCKSEEEANALVMVGVCIAIQLPETLRLLSPNDFGNA